MNAQVEEAVMFARKYPAQYRTWLGTMVAEVGNDFLCQLLKDTEHTNLAADWLIFLADEPFANPKPITKPKYKTLEQRCRDLETQLREVVDEGWIGKNEPRSQAIQKLLEESR